MCNENYKYDTNHLDAVVAVMDDLSNRDPKTDKALLRIEKYRELHGAAEYRRACYTFAINTETLINSFTDDEREEIFDLLVWDFEYIPELITRLAETINTATQGVKYWFAADLAFMRETHNKIIEGFTNNKGCAAKV